MQMSSQEEIVRALAADAAAADALAADAAAAAAAGTAAAVGSATCREAAAAAVVAAWAATEKAEVKAAPVGWQQQLELRLMCLAVHAAAARLLLGPASSLLQLQGQQTRREEQQCWLVDQLPSAVAEQPRTATLVGQLQQCDSHRHAAARGAHLL